ncbi:hypothetical protein RDABS01_019391 [Bienertia sinuspersici]
MGDVGVLPNHEFLGAKRIGTQITENKGLSFRTGLVLPAVTKFKSQQPIRIKCQAVNQGPSTYSSQISTDVPFYETPGASFDQYLEDKPRVFRAIFPDKRRSKQLNEVRWELQGLDNVVPPSHFTLRIHGTLYPDRRGAKSRLKGQLEIHISVILPPGLSLIPEDVRQSVSESVLKKLAENMKDRVNSSLLADFGKFQRERQMNPV